MSALIKRYKHRLFLAGLIIILPWIAYSYAISDTVKLYSDYKTESSAVMQLQQQSLGNKQTATTDIRELIHSAEVLDSIEPTIKQHNISVVQYAPYMTIAGDGESLSSAELTISSGFISAVKLVDYIEKHLPACRIISLNFNTVNKYGVRTGELQTKIIIQQIVKTK